MGKNTSNIADEIMQNNETSDAFTDSSHTAKIATRQAQLNSLILSLKK